jgi:D-alanyl-D-alanine carboxypeptidase
MTLLLFPAVHPCWRRRIPNGHRFALAVVALAGLIAACSSADASDPGSTGSTPTRPTVPASSPATGGTASSNPDPSTEVGQAPPATGPAGPLPTRPSWLGTRVLPTRAIGLAVPQTTPEELVDRRFAAIDVLPPPPDGRFHATVGPLEGEPLNRSTWNESCPVTVDQLRYLTLSFWGFDDRAHTGELIVNAEVADDVVTAFQSLFSAKFPLEEMRITTQAEVGAPPIGDGNDTSAFVCRVAVGSTRFSEHAYGLAIDINPFLNPYLKRNILLPELADVYTDRATVRPGMIVDGGPVVAAFDAIGWGWGGRWSSLKDYQHFALHDR